MMAGGMVLAARLPRMPARAASTPARNVSRMVTDSRGDGREGIWPSSSYRTTTCGHMGFNRINDADSWKYKRSDYWFLLGDEIAEEVFKRLLVGIVVVPLSNVAAMQPTAHISW